MAPLSYDIQSGNDRSEAGSTCLSRSGDGEWPRRRVVVWYRESCLLAARGADRRRLPGAAQENRHASASKSTVIGDYARRRCGCGQRGAALRCPSPGDIVVLRQDSAYVCRAPRLSLELRRACVSGDKPHFGILAAPMGRTMSESDGKGLIQAEISGFSGPRRCPGGEEAWPSRDEVR